jgi:hypothetical protein
MNSMGSFKQATGQHGSFEQARGFHAAFLLHTHTFKVVTDRAMASTWETSAGDGAAVQLFFL